MSLKSFKDLLKNAEKIKVSATVGVVPYEKMTSLFDNNVASEGNYRKNVPLFFLSPQSNGFLSSQAKRAEASKEKVQKVFEAMQKLREHQSPPTVNLGNNSNLDIGLIDIQVFFKGNDTKLKQMLKINDGSNIVQENLQHLDIMLEDDFKKYIGTFKEQISIITALHKFAPNGAFMLRCHNVIFNLKRDGENLSYLDINSLLSSLARGGKPISLIIPI